MTLSFILSFPIQTLTLTLTLTRTLTLILTLIGWQVMAFAQGWSLVNNVTLLLSNLRQATGSGSGLWSSGRQLQLPTV